MTRINSAGRILLMTQATVAPSSLPKRRLPDWRARAAAALAAVIATAGTVHGEVRVKGDAGAVQVDATRSNVGEVLSALESAFRLRVNTTMALDKAVSGTFTGSLAQVLSRTLQGYNYFIKRQAAEIELTVVALQGDRAAALARPRVPKNPAMSLSEAVRLKQ
jgi:hypothetical protein